MENNELSSVESNGNKKTTSNPSSKRKGGFIWYPFLFAVYPVLGLLAVNVSEARPEAALRLVLLALALTALLMGALRLALKDWHRAAILTSAWMGLFAAYGHVYGDLLEKAETYARHPWLGGVSLVLAALALFLATRPKVRWEAWAAPLTAAAIVLVVFPLWTVVSYQVGRLTPEVHADAPYVVVEGERPDIYYIVLDMYTRADTLKDAYGYDNSEFIGGLETMGFDVAECAMRITCARSFRFPPRST